MPTTPQADWKVDEDLIRHLLVDQFPDLAGMPMSMADEGWDNFIYRLGERHAVRLPRRPIAAELLLREQKWLPEIAARVSIPIPVPLRMGAPSELFPWPWTVCEWFDGTASDLESPATPEAAKMASFLTELHTMAPPDAPENSFRGIGLQQIDRKVCECFDRLRQTEHAFPDSIERLWHEAVAAPEEDEVRWIHGDLHARNVIVNSGKIASIVDWGDMAAGDVATDLACVWSLFPEEEARDTCLDLYAPTSDQITRAKGWATNFAAILIDSGRADHPRHLKMGQAIVERLLDTC